ncbi:P-loop ATPase/GTPase-like protein [Ferroglobus placidus DSM 10642]|uniref:p-loop ATPase/GTPase-like protein n=1 Tax=Ferroglobus placidus (strain DSM 10642 / AEDII12DO) TaxID=589924 RepID=D3RX56_FERPA|nr:P-loop ATPase/GTPase-like protein [Ferroglobus placidus]ADC65069.1 P-loop ATPase/GTPase-like protein [Ferroglobus placidus DSM 10642]
MLILVVGVGQHVGKTKAVEEIVKAFRGEGFSVEFSKPLATLNAFYHEKAFERILEIGEFVSHDVLRVSELVKGEEKLEILNPVFSLLLPIDLEAVDWNTTSLESPVFQTAVVRIEESIYVVEPLSRFVKSFLKRVERILRNREISKVEIESVNDLLLSGRDASNEILKKLKRKSEILVVESSGNLAYPNEESLEADKVVIVTPGKYFVCDGERYRKAAEIAGKLAYLRCEDVVEILKPKKGYENIKNLIKKELLNH